LNNVSVFDLKTGAVLGQIATGQNPDAIMYDDYSKKVITCNGRSNDLSVIDPVSGTVVTTIPVGGKPETAVSDGAGKIYINIEDKSEIAVVDIDSKEVKARWSLAPGEGPTGLAIDRKTHRLFAGCDKMLIVVNTESGAIAANVTIGDGCDGVGFDEGRKLVFASCGEGVLSVVKEESASKFTLLDNVPTKRGARTIAVDEPTHSVYLPTADFQPQAAGATGRPQMIPGSFQVVVVAK
jgi:YVTN family beta-propeller protein